MSLTLPGMDKSLVRAPWRLLAGVLSLPYLLLRGSTAVAAVASGLVQTFVFAHVLDAHTFSVFIIIGAAGVSLWLFDLGAAKILYVRQRALFLAGTTDAKVARQSTGVVVVYAAMVLAAFVTCFIVMTALQSVDAFEALQYALFLNFAALNLVWYPLRNVASAIDDYFHFEGLEAIRRAGHMGLMLAMLAGLSLTGFLVLANLLWFVLIGLCFTRLARARAIDMKLAGMWAALKEFWRENKRDILAGGNYALADFAIYNFPYLAVPVLFGLGAPTIILDTLFKMFRGISLLYGPGLDPLLPKQTHAYAEGDFRTLKHATAASAVLCAVPTVLTVAILMFWGDMLFARLLGESATMPDAAVGLLIVLLIANLGQAVASNLMLHTGYFSAIAQVATVTCITLAAMTGIVAVTGHDLMVFIAGYTAIYTVAAVWYVLRMARGPFRGVWKPA